MLLKLLGLGSRKNDTMWKIIALSGVILIILVTICLLVFKLLKYRHIMIEEMLARQQQIRDHVDCREFPIEEPEPLTEQQIALQEQSVAFVLAHPKEAVSILQEWIADNGN